MKGGLPLSYHWTDFHKGKNKTHIWEKGQKNCRQGRLWVYRALPCGAQQLGAVYHAKFLLAMTDLKLSPGSVFLSVSCLFHNQVHISWDGQPYTRAATYKTICVEFRVKPSSDFCFKEGSNKELHWSSVYLHQPSLSKIVFSHLPKQTSKVMNVKVEKDVGNQVFFIINEHGTVGQFTSLTSLCPMSREDSCKSDCRAWTSPSNPLCKVFWVHRPTCPAAFWRRTAIEMAVTVKPSFVEDIFHTFVKAQPFLSKVLSLVFELF